MKSLNAVLEKHLPVLQEQLAPTIKEWNELNEEVAAINSESSQLLKIKIQNIIGDIDSDLLEITVKNVTNVAFKCATDNRTILDIYAQGTRDEETNAYYIQNRDVHVHWSNTGFGVSISGSEILDPANTLVNQDMTDHLECAYRLNRWLRKYPQDLERIVTAMSIIFSEMKQKKSPLIERSNDLYNEMHKIVNDYIASDLVYNDFSFGMDLGGFVGRPRYARNYPKSYLEPKYNRKTSSKISITHTAPADVPTNESRNSTMDIKDLNANMADWMMRRLNI